MSNVTNCILHLETHCIKIIISGGMNMSRYRHNTIYSYFAMRARSLFMLYKFSARIAKFCRVLLWRPICPEWTRSEMRASCREHPSVCMRFLWFDWQPAEYCSLLFAMRAWTELKIFIWRRDGKCSHTSARLIRLAQAEIFSMLVSAKEFAHWTSFGTKKYLRFVSTNSILGEMSALRNCCRGYVWHLKTVKVIELI